jgi:hypothetical protein
MEVYSDAPPAKLEENVEESASSPSNDKPRQDIAAWKWILICVAMYLGALLYGIIFLYLIMYRN